MGRNTRFVFISYEIVLLQGKFDYQYYFWAENSKFWKKKSTIRTDRRRGNLSITGRFGTSGRYTSFLISSEEALRQLLAPRLSAEGDEDDEDDELMSNDMVVESSLLNRRGRNGLDRKAQGIGGRNRHEGVVSRSRGGQKRAKFLSRNFWYVLSSYLRM
jgi:hypothetical protein